MPERPINLQGGMKMMTEAMQDRARALGTEWTDEGDGYYSISGYVSRGFMGGDLAYVALPLDHPDIGKRDDEVDPEVNGGLTFHEGNVFGWDYMHAYNGGSPETDIPAALEYFRSRAMRVGHG